MTAGGTDSALLRAAGLADIGLLAGLHGVAFPGGEIWNARAFAMLLATPGAFALLIEAVDAPLGFVLARSAGGEAEILSIGVRPDRARRGLGLRLLEAALGRLARGGAESCFLEGSAENPAALALYARAGFRQVGRRAGYYTLGDRAVDALVLRRDLAGGAV